MKLLLLKDRDVLSRLMDNQNQSEEQKQQESTISKTKTNLDIRRLNSLLAQLRKAANHPYLFPGVEIPNLDGSATEEIVTASGKMIILDRLLDKLFANGHRVVLFSQYTRTLDIINDYLILRNKTFLRLDGQTNRVMREVYSKYSYSYCDSLSFFSLNISI